MKIILLLFFQNQEPMITSDQSIEYPFIDFYIRYNSKGGYASHPYPLQLISDLICIKYSQLLLNK